MQDDSHNSFFEMFLRLTHYYGKQLKNILNSRQISTEELECTFIFIN